MKIGMVCPYSFDVPGGVQFHVRDLAQYLIGKGHDVSVLAPANRDTDLPHYVTSCGRAVPIRYNGSVARVNFGPATASRVRSWMSGRSFDVLHLHEPVTPSAALLALWAADCPTVATFHAATPRSRVMQAAGPMLRTSLSKLTARVAVSESARRTAAQHTTSDITVVPNGVYVDSFSTATARHKWTGTVDSPTLAFVGRFDEPRKGFRVLSQALPTILSASPRARIFIAGRGNETAARRLLTPAVSAACSFLGPVSEQEKATLLSSVDLFVAPHTGGESFGVVVLEAMSAGTAILSSDIAPFVDLLDNGACGAIFGNCDPDDLAYQAAQLLNNPNRRARLIRQGSKKALTYDWSVVGDKVLSTYEHANGQLV